MGGWEPGFADGKCSGLSIGKFEVKLTSKQVKPTASELHPNRHVSCYEIITIHFVEQLNCIVRV